MDIVNPTPDSEDLNHRLDQLISVLLNDNNTPKIDIRLVLWNTKDVANYAKVSSKYASEHIVSHYSFPMAVRLPTKKASRGHPRWYAKEVMDWVKKHQSE